MDTDTTTVKSMPNPPAHFTITMVSLIHNVEVARDFPKRTCGLKFKMPKLAPDITVLNDPEEGELPEDADTGIGASYENA